VGPLLPTNASLVEMGWWVSSTARLSSPVGRRYARPMLLIIGTVRLPPENLEAARPAMRRMVEASRREDGCIEYVYAQDLFDPGLIHVRELWTDRAALDAHFASPPIARWRAAWPGLGIGDRDLRLYEVGEPRRT